MFFDDTPMAGGTPADDTPKDEEIDKDEEMDGDEDEGQV